MTFEEVLTRHHIRYKTSSKPQEIRICCLFCPEQGQSVDTRFRLWINTGSGAGICYNCRWKSRHAIAYVLRRIKAPDVVEGSSGQTVTAKEEPVKLPDGFQLLRNADRDDDLEREALQYLLHRGVTREQVASKRIGITFAGRYAYRIVFPLHVVTDLVGFTARVYIGDREPKYLHSSGPKYLYNFDPTQTTAVLSEGVFKALRLEHAVAGLPVTSAALLGHSVTPTQLDQLSNSAVREIILYPDPDSVGCAGMASVIDELRDRNSDWKIRIVWPVTRPADDTGLSIGYLRHLVDDARECTLEIRDKIMHTGSMGREAIAEKERNKRDE